MDECDIPQELLTQIEQRVARECAELAKEADTNYDAERLILERFGCDPPELREHSLRSSRVMKSWWSRLTPKERIEYRARLSAGRGSRRAAERTRKGEELAMQVTVPALTAAW